MTDCWSNFYNNLFYYIIIIIIIIIIIEIIIVRVRARAKIHAHVSMSWNLWEFIDEDKQTINRNFKAIRSVGFDDDDFKKMGPIAYRTPKRFFVGTTARTKDGNVYSDRANLHRLESDRMKSSGSSCCSEDSSKTLKKKIEVLEKQKTRLSSCSSSSEEKEKEDRYDDDDDDIAIISRRRSSTKDQQIFVIERYRTFLQSKNFRLPSWLSTSRSS